MLFNSLQFIIFFFIVYSLYLVLTHRYQNYWLLLASYYFYSCWNWHFLFLMLFSTTMDYWFGLAIYQINDQRHKRLILTTSISTNLGLLFVFKYFNFFALNLQHLLASLHLAVDMHIINVVLPIGISFYTFHNISYIVDIYRGRVEPTRNFVNFALYVALFPQLVAGPIARPSHLLPQIENKRHITYRMLSEGCWLILLGYFKKVVLADNMVPFTAFVFQSPTQAHGLQILFGIYAFAFQIYGDFSGYSDIARGLSKLMGFELMLNFNHPYFATNPADFWRRWHISLSSWLRDYLYIPLGGNRHGPRKTYRNLFITMFLGGLWHGAAWHYIAWGVFHGLLLIGHRMVEPGIAAFRARHEPQLLRWRGFLRICAMIGFFHITCIGWLLFAVTRLTDISILLHNLVHPLTFNGSITLATIILFAGPLLGMEWAEERSGRMPVAIYWSRPVRLACYATIVAMIILCGAVEKHEFIYFQF